MVWIIYDVLRSVNTKLVVDRFHRPASRRNRWALLVVAIVLFLVQIIQGRSIGNA
jgi:hypothetical protein